MMSSNAATKTTSTYVYASLKYSPSCFAASCDKKVSIISTSGEVITTFTRPEATSEVSSMLALCDGTLVVACDDGTVQKWSLDDLGDPRPREPLWEVRIVANDPLKLAELDGRVVVGRADGTVFLLGGATGALILAAVCDELDYHLREIIPLGGSFMDGTASFATFSNKGEIHTWRRPEWALSKEARFEATRVRRDLTIKFYAFAHHLGDGGPSSGLVAVMGHNCSVHLFKLPTWELVWEVPALYKENGHESGTPALVFSPDGGFVAVAPWIDDQTVRLICAKTGEVLRTHTLDHSPDTFLNLSSSSSSIFTGVFADDDDEGDLQEGDEDDDHEDDEDDEDDEGDVEDEKFRVGVWRPFQEEEARIKSLLYERSPADLVYQGGGVLEKLFIKIRRSLESKS